MLTRKTNSRQALNVGERMNKKLDNFLYNLPGKRVPLSILLSYLNCNSIAEFMNKADKESWDIKEKLKEAIKHFEQAKN